MSRGRPPRQACKEACTRAAQRGTVLGAAGLAGSHIDFILFVQDRVIFIRVKRSHSRIIATGELVVRFSNEITGLRKVPQTPVVSRELWILLPWGTWQYFGIGNESITEIPNEIMRISGTQDNFGTVQDQQNPPPANTSPFFASGTVSGEPLVLPGQFSGIHEDSARM
jgi:hypothetical protein